MTFMDKIRRLFGKADKAAPAAADSPKTPAPVSGGRLQKACKNCGKLFSYDPSWDHIPNFCKECKQQFTKEKEEKQRAGEPRKIRRKCKQCGKFFTFPSTLAHYPNYCSNCRKQHQAAMKAKYNQKKAAK